MGTSRLNIQSDLRIPSLMKVTSSLTAKEREGRNTEVSHNPVEKKKKKDMHEVLELVVPQEFRVERTEDERVRKGRP